jgi:uncharacterized membrane protein
MKQRTDLLKQLLEVESHEVDKLKDIVSRSLKEEKFLAHKLRSEYQEKASFGDRLADKVTQFGGSWSFIIWFVVLFFSWILVNVYALLGRDFDPYPFILLNLFLSLVAALQAPVIMMSQRRQDRKDRERSEHDYLINLKSELEIRSLHEKIDMLIVDRMSVLLKSQKRQLEILELLEKQSEKE